MRNRFLEETNLKPWLELREHLESSTHPLEDVIEFFRKFPAAKMYTDPYNRTSWPTPWELISENIYCPFNFILGICYTLQLTERFKDCQPKIHITFDISDKTMYYLLIIGDRVYGYTNDDWCTINQLPKSLKIKKMYVMHSIH
jgi:hypothetical protein